MSLATLDALIEAAPAPVAAATVVTPLRESIARVRLREGTYEAGKDHLVYFQDADTVTDAAHLYAVLKEEADTGSPNLENELVREMLHQLQLGQALGGDQLGKLLELLDKYATEIQAFRENPDTSQDIMAVPDANTARIIR